MSSKILEPPVVLVSEHINTEKSTIDTNENIHVKRVLDIEFVLWGDIAHEVDLLGFLYNIL
jgi:hypothetical protein